MVPEDFKIYYLGLSDEQKKEVVSSLLAMGEEQSQMNSPTHKPLRCPHCEHDDIVGNGKTSKGVQRYRCKGCLKFFSSTTGKMWYHIHKKDLIGAYLHCLLSGYSLRRSAKEVGISEQTSFNWRHKLLTSFESISSENFEGIVESDETYFLHSQKGNKELDRKPRKRGTTANKDGINDEHVAVIVTMDRKGNQAMKVIKRGRITTEDIIGELGGKITQNSVLCTDGHPSYAGFARRENVEQKKILASKNQKVVDKHYHLQNVNSLDSRLKKFIAKFNGVSSKYLQNYLNWFLALEKVKNMTTKFQTLTAIALSSSCVWALFKEITNKSFLF